MKRQKSLFPIKTPPIWKILFKVDLKERWYWPAPAEDSSPEEIVPLPGWLIYRVEFWATTIPGLFLFNFVFFSLSCRIQCKMWRALKQSSTKWKWLLAFNPDLALEICPIPVFNWRRSGCRKPYSCRKCQILCPIIIQSFPQPWLRYFTNIAELDSSLRFEGFS